MLNINMRTTRTWLRALVTLVFLCTTLSLFSQETVEIWKKKAVTDYPELGTSGSPMNLKFIQMVNSLKITNPSYFKDPKWPYTLAQEVAGVKTSPSGTIPGLDNNQKTVPERTPPQAPQQSLPQSLMPAQAPQQALPQSLAPAPQATDESSVEAQKLAVDFKDDPKAANLRYFGKRLTITGEIARITPSDNPANVAFVYLNTGNGLPGIKVELNRMKSYTAKTTSGFYYTEKNGFELRVNNNSTLEVRSHETHTSTHPYYYNHSSVQNGDWCPVITKGEVIKIQGTCKGRSVDVILSNSDLEKSN